ncbi:MAG: Sec-independent protein translocase subunit TatA/TatB [Candidatus Limnocylindrales bacterium]
MPLRHSACTATQRRGLVETPQGVNVMPWGLTPAHLIIVLVIVLIVVGPGKLPDTGAAIGKALRGFKDAMETGEAHPDASQQAAQPTPPQYPVQPQYPPQAGQPPYQQPQYPPQVGQPPYQQPYAPQPPQYPVQAPYPPQPVPGQPYVPPVDPTAAPQGEPPLKP